MNIEGINHSVYPAQSLHHANVCILLCFLCPVCAYRLISWSTGWTSWRKSVRWREGRVSSWRTTLRTGQRENRSLSWKEKMKCSRSNYRIYNPSYRYHMKVSQPVKQSFKARRSGGDGPTFQHVSITQISSTSHGRQFWSDFYPLFKSCFMSWPIFDLNIICRNKTCKLLCTEYFFCIHSNQKKLQKLRMATTTNILPATIVKPRVYKSFCSKQLPATLISLARRVRVNHNLKEG